MKIKLHIGLFRGADTTYDGNVEYLIKGNKWSVSGAENGAERAENRMSWNGAMSEGHRKRWRVSGARSGGLRSKNGAESGGSKCLER